MVNGLNFFLRKFIDRQNAGLTDESGWLVLSSPHTSSTIFSIVNAPFFPHSDIQRIMEIFEKKNNSFFESQIFILGTWELYKIS